MQIVAADMNNSNIDIFQIVRMNDEEEYTKYINMFDINVLNEYDQSLLHEAIAFSANRIVNDLIDRGIDINKVDQNGQTPLHYAAVHHDLSSIKNIVSNGGDINIRDKYNNNALWTAVFNAKGKYYEIVQYMMTKNADAITKNNAQKSPLDFANKIGDKTLIGILNKDKFKV